MTFPLDMVRDSVTSDVTAFLGRIEAQARVLNDLPTEWPAGAALEAIGVQCHGIAGTTSLVGLGSVSGSARALEHLAEVGHELVSELELIVARTRDLGRLYLDGAVALRTMFDHELAGEGAAATKVAAEFAERLAVARAGDLRGLQGQAALAPPVSGAGAGLAPPTPSAAPPVPPELAAIFLEEAREAAVSVRELQRAFVAAPGPATAEPIERLFHTLKGAAATVGLGDVAAMARQLQLQLAAIADGEQPADANVAALIGRETQRWFALAGVADVAFDDPNPEAPRAVFEREAARLLTTAGQQHRAGQGDELRRTLHLLKGSAMVVAAGPMAAAAADLERALEVGVGAADVEIALAGLRALLPATAAAAPSSDPRATATPPPSPARFQLTAAIDAELWEAFQQECQELLEGIDRDLLILEAAAASAGADEARTIEQLFRQYHTLKGSVNTIGLRPIGDLIHDIEDVLEGLVASPSARATKPLVGLLLEVQRAIRKGLTQAARGFVELDLTRVRGHLAALRADHDGPSVAEPRSLDTASPVTHGPDSVSSASDASSATLDTEGRRYIRVPLERLDALMNLAGELVIGRSRLAGRSGLLRAIQRELGVGRRRLVDTVERFSTEHEFANLDGRAARGPLALASAAPVASFGQVASIGQVASLPDFSALELDRYEDIHILARSLTELSTDFREMDGELVRELENFHEDADRLGSLVSTLQGEITRARMVSVESLFARLRLPIRDAAERERKEVRVQASGEEVSLDKAIADALFAPLLHVVRNAVSHGIEATGDRRDRGNPAHGTVTLAARQEAGRIVIEIADDGGGLDRHALRARGAALGLVARDLALDDPAIAELVFAPGLSTSDTVGSVAGRGLGGNVVKRAVERLGGSVRIASSSQGTRFTIALPVTLAITRAVVVRSGDSQYAIPLYFAERIRDVGEVELIESAGVRRLAEGDELLQVTSLREVMGLGVVGPGRAYVLVRVGTDAAALEVDEVVGQEEIVVKSLGPVLDGHPVFAGVTFRGTGELALILDVPSILEGLVRTQRPTATSAPEVAVTAAPSLPAATPRPTVRVLFIDDSVSVRKVAERTLRELGVEVTLASDGLDGLTKLREGEFDLVFTDLEMPRMHGYDLLREIRYIPSYASLPVVVVSSRSGSKHQDQARTLGATDYVTKPFSPESLAAILQRWGRRG